MIRTRHHVSRELALFCLFVLCACAGSRAPETAPSAPEARAAQPALVATANVPPAAPAPAQPSAHAERGGSSALALAPLERALATIEPAEIRSDLFFIASDELAGRDTPSAGLRIAARYLRARLERFGFEPGAKDGYFFTFPLTQSRLDFDACSARATAGGTSAAFLFGSDYFLASENDVFASDVSAPAVWCGNGTDEEFHRAAPKGKWAVCADEGEQGFKVYRRARSAGAAGLVVVESADVARTYAARYGRMETLRRGDVDFPSPPRAGETPRAAAHTERVPRVWLTRAAFARALQLAGRSAEALAPGTDLGFAFTETRALDAATTIDVENVCGLWPGSDPVLSDEVILVTAHYDHLGVRNGVVSNGADDNGSGTCGLLALAEALHEYGPLRRSVMLMWVAGEEKGLWGSKAWTNAPWLPGGRRALCDLNIDMIGRNAPDALLITPTKERDEYNALVRLAEQLAPLEGFPTLGSADAYYTRSDHYNFAKQGIPAAFLFSGEHVDYHQPTDDPEKIDYDKVHRVVRLVFRMLAGLQQDTTGL
jgi:hypothetical protein